MTIGRLPSAPLVATLLALSGCQGVFSDEPNLALTAAQQRLGPPPTSAQRVDAGGFPLLGAFPGTAAPQLQPDAVAAERERLAAASAAAQAGGGSPAADYQAALARSAKLRQEQRLALDRALPGTGEAAAGASRTPANDDLRRSVDD